MGKLVSSTIERRLAMEKRRERLSGQVAEPGRAVATGSGAASSAGSATVQAVSAETGSSAVPTATVVELIDLTVDEPVVRRADRGATAERLLTSKEDKSLVVVSSDGDRMVEDPDNPNTYVITR